MNETTPIDLAIAGGNTEASSVDVLRQMTADGQIIVADDLVQSDDFIADPNYNIIPDISDPPIRKIDPNTPIKASDIPSMIKGNARLPGETQEAYRERQKMEKKLLAFRLRVGVSYLAGTKTPHRSVDRAYKKAIAKNNKATNKAAKAERRRLLEEQKSK